MIKIAIATNQKFCKHTLPIVIPSLLEAGIEVEDIHVFNAGFEIYSNEIIDKISKYIKIKDLHFEKLLCSLYVFSRALEGFMYETSKKLLKDKYKDYEKLPIKSTEQIFAVIASNLPDEYKYNKNTKILLIDNVSQTMSEHTLDKKEILNINEITHLARGTYINDIIIQNK